jgi:hypothetical protein
MWNKLVLATASAALVAACSSTPKIPDWVSMPQVEGGLADTACVDYSGDFSLSKTEATTLARGELARQLELRAKVMDKSYKHRTAVQGGANQGGSFESVIKNLADAVLIGSRPAKVEILEIGDKQQLCAMVTLGEKETKEVFDNLIDKSGVPALSHNDEAVLYEEFRAAKATEEMERSLGQ